MSKAKTKKQTPPKQNPKPNVFQNIRRFFARIDSTQTSSIPIKLAYAYLALPMYIFLFGWLKFPFALLMAAVLTIGLYFAWKHAPEMDVSQICTGNIPKLLAIALFALLWVYLSGIGGFAYQNYDHMWRNGILEKLVTEDWPVIITDTGEYFDSPVAMIYYFAIWLPAACIGKSLGLQAAHTFLYWWCAAGVLLVFLLLTGLTKRVSPWMILAFIFFSGLDAVGDLLLHNSSGYLWLASNHLENWAFGFQMSSHSTQLFWVFNQAIPAWLITLMLLHQKDNRSVIFIYSFSFLFCTLPAIGMLPILACIGIVRIVKTYDRSKPFKQNWKPICTEAITFQNIAAGGLLALMSFLFLRSNSTGTSDFRAADMSTLLMPYLIFVFLEFLVYYLAIFRHQKKNPLFYVSLVTLLVVPTIYFGAHVDFVMRASIPSLVVLFVLLMETLPECEAHSDKLRKGVIIVLLLLGGVTAYHEIIRSVTRTIEKAKDPSVSITADEIDLYEDGKRNNFFGEYEDSVFFRYFVKK